MKVVGWWVVVSFAIGFAPLVSALEEAPAPGRFAGPEAFAPAQMEGCDCGDMQGSMASHWWDSYGLGASVGVGAVASGGVGWLGWRRGWWQRLLPVALFSRFEPDEMARHPSRAALLEALRAEPGLTTGQLASRSGMNVGTLLYHLRALEAHGLVRSARLGRERGWWEADGRPLETKGIAALRSPVRFTLVETIGLLPGLTQVELAQRVGRSKATVHHHLEELVLAGFVEARRDGRVVRYFPSSANRGPWERAAPTAFMAAGES